ncbi:MAG: sigma 54-interacting transcriptional regulator [Solidesulfovibrio sp.]
MKKKNDHLALARMVFDCFPLGVFAVDTQMKVLTWNQTMEDLSSIPAGEAVGKDIGLLLNGTFGAHDFTPGEFFTMLMTQYGTDVAAGLNCHGVLDSHPLVLTAHPGKAFHLFSNPLRRTPDTFDGLACLLMDRDPQTGHRCREHFHKRLLGLSPGMAYQILNDGKWTIRYVSEGCLDLTGYSQEHFRDKTFSILSELFHPEDETEALGTFYTSIANDKPYEHEFRIVDAAGQEKWICNRGHGVFSECQELVSVEGFMTDMSHYKKTEQRLRDERQLLRTALRDRKSFGQLLGQSPVMHKVYDLIIKAAMSDDSVFVFGETGTGKELVARAIHTNSPRHNGPYVAVNCGAIPETLIEGEFFGHKRGAFTGATQDKKGYLEAASGGTLFLDEIGEISLGMQVKLLRALETGGFSPVGGNEVIKPNLRIVAASNKDLNDLVQAGLIRRDFFYRIYVIPISLPPLRDRGEDVKLLAEHFVKVLGKSRDVHDFSKAEYELLKSYSWPGNVRELQNAVRRFLTLGNFDFLRDILDQEFVTASKNSEECDDGDFNLQTAVESFEKRLIVRALDEVKWHKIKAASRLGISRRTLFRKIKELGLE